MYPVYSLKFTVVPRSGLLPQAESFPKDTGNSSGGPPPLPALYMDAQLTATPPCEVTAVTAFAEK